MDWASALALMLGTLVVLMMLGLPVAIAFLGVNILGAWLFLGGDIGLDQMARNTMAAVSKFQLVPIPLFLLMGEIMYHTGMAHRAIDAVDRLIARVPGRLSLVAVVSGTIFSALSGSTIANTAMLGSTLLPEMRRRGYDPIIAMGPILGTGGIAMLIPPSALAVILASLGSISVADLLIAGIVPALVMAALFFGYVIARCAMNPSLAPAYESSRLNRGERFRPFLLYVVPLLSIFVVVVGSILGGYASPTESAALGSLASVIAAIGYRCLTWRSLRIAIQETAKVSVMILFIICASITYSQILAFSGATDGLLAIVRDAGLAPVVLVIGMLAILVFLGCFMDQVSMMMITLPFFMPLVALAGVDPVWFGLLMLIALEVGFTTPPFGLLLFVMKGVAPDVTMRQICWAAAPFIALEILTIALVMAFPGLALWLPHFLRT
jgi:tripartite ATP-independent transporter DctM subunit